MSILPLRDQYCHFYCFPPPRRKFEWQSQSYYKNRKPVYNPLTRSILLKVQGSRFFIIHHIHNHTSIISSEMQVELKKNTAFTWGKWGEKNNPQTMLLGEYSVRTGKTPQQHKSTYTTYPHVKWIRPSKQPSGPAATDPALVRPAWPGQRIEANRGEWSGGGGAMILLNQT